MSWPTDGLPRFVLVRTDGILDMPYWNGRSMAKNITRWSATFAILDRAFCHREVAKFRSEAHGGKMENRIARAQALAEVRLAEILEERVAA